MSAAESVGKMLDERLPDLMIYRYHTEDTSYDNIADVRATKELLRSNNFPLFTQLEAAKAFPEMQE